jgi:quercetin dioxygenase-like cupin family protein
MAESGKQGADKMPAAEALALPGLVEIAPGAIVSRVLAKSGGGTVTLFAFDAGQGLSEHTAPFDALVQVVQGELELTIGGNRVHAATGDLVLMPADVPHALHAPVGTKMLLTMLRQVNPLMEITGKE